MPPRINYDVLQPIQVSYKIVKNNTELGAKKILFLSLARRVMSGTLMNLAGTQFYYLKNWNNNSYFTAFFH